MDGIAINIWEVLLLYQHDLRIFPIWRWVKPYYYHILRHKDPLTIYNLEFPGYQGFDIAIFFNSSSHRIGLVGNILTGFTMVPPIKFGA